VRIEFHLLHGAVAPRNSVGDPRHGESRPQKEQ
jgi:hypothetical protein